MMMILTHSVVPGSPVKLRSIDKSTYSHSDVAEVESTGTLLEPTAPGFDDVENGEYV